MLAPLGASLNVLAARKMLMSVLTLTEEAGALSRSEAEALRERAAESAAAAAAAAECSSGSQAAEGKEEVEEEEDEEDEEEEEEAEERGSRRGGGMAPRAATLKATLEAERQAILRGLPQLAKMHAPLVRASALLQACPPGARLLVPLAPGAGAAGASPPADGELLAGVLEGLLHSSATQLSILEARQERLEGDGLLEIAMHGAEELNVDYVHYALDSYKRAGIRARGVDLESEAMALAAQGRVYARVLKFETRAYQRYFEAISLALACAPRVLSHHSWLLEAREFVHKIRSARERAEELEGAAVELESLAGMEEQVAAIDAASKKGAVDLLRHIFEHHRASVDGVLVMELVKDAVKGCVVLKWPLGVGVGWGSPSGGVGGRVHAFACSAHTQC